MADVLYLVKWSIALDERPIESFSTEREALGRIRKLFIEHSAQGLHVELYLNSMDALYIGFGRLSQWNARRRSRRAIS
jgi:hypothetical protein